MRRVFYTLAVVFALASFAQAQTGEFEHEFTYKPDGNPTKIAVAGDFKMAAGERRGSDRVSRTRGRPCGQDHPRVALPNRQIGWTCSACGPLAPRAGVYSTRWLSWRLR